MIELPDNILNNTEIIEIFLVTLEKCYKINKDCKFNLVHPSLDSSLTEYILNINYKDGSCSTISLEK